MITSVHEWVTFLKNSGSLFGVPLLIGGAVLLIFGWRLWKFCIVISFGLIGAGVGTILAGTSNNQLFYSLAIGGVFGGASYWSVKYSVGILGGITGAGAIAYFLSSFRIGELTFCLLVAGAFGVFTAYSFINRKLVVIFVTSLLGSVLIVSGLTVFIMESKIIYGNFHTMATSSAFVIPFILMVPTMMSCFYQVAAVRRTGSEL